MLLQRTISRTSIYRPADCFDLFAIFPEIAECFEHRLKIHGVKSCELICRNRLENALNDMLPEGTIGFKLRFSEPLVRRGLMWEAGMLCFVVQHV